MSHSNFRFNASDLPPINVILGNVPHKPSSEAEIELENEEINFKVRDVVVDFLENKTCFIKAQTAARIQQLEKECKIVCKILLENILYKMGKGNYVKMAEINTKENIKNVTFKKQFLRLSKRRKEIEFAEENLNFSAQTNIYPIKEIEKIEKGLHLGHSSKSKKLLNISLTPAEQTLSFTIFFKKEITTKSLIPDKFLKRIVVIFSKVEEFGTFFDGLSTLTDDLYTLYNKSQSNDITPFTLYEIYSLMTVRSATNDIENEINKYRPPIATLPIASRCAFVHQDLPSIHLKREADKSVDNKSDINNLGEFPELDEEITDFLADQKLTDHAPKSDQIALEALMLNTISLEPSLSSALLSPTHLQKIPNSPKQSEKSSDNGGNRNSWTSVIPNRTPRRILLKAESENQIDNRIMKRSCTESKSPRNIISKDEKSEGKKKKKDKEKTTEKDNDSQEDEEEMTPRRKKNRKKSSTISNTSALECKQ